MARQKSNDLFCVRFSERDCDDGTKWKVVDVH
jgi:hypothetical protein